MKILVADDSKTNLALLTYALENLGHEVLAVTSGEEAVEAFEKNHPDLVILDVVMKNMSGFECAQQIRSRDGEDWIPIIFLSSSVDDASIAQGISAGGDDYLAKPVSEVTLAAKIKAMQRISEMRKKLYEATQELKILSATDTLTGIYNRLQYERALKEKLSEADRHQYLLALMFIDLDYFKKINDTVGHHIGDLLLKEIATRIKSCLRLEDFLARIGGDEFVVIVSNLKNQKYAGTIADKILKHINFPYQLDGNCIDITASIGIANYPTEDTNHHNIAQHADLAMYHAKKIGRNNYQYFTSVLQQK